MNLVELIVSNYRRIIFHMDYEYISKNHRKTLN
jgi:hypothetical protein